MVTKLLHTSVLYSPKQLNHSSKIQGQQFVTNSMSIFFYFWTVSWLIMTIEKKNKKNTSPYISYMVLVLGVFFLVNIRALTAVLFSFVGHITVNFVKCCNSMFKAVKTLCAAGSSRSRVWNIGIYNCQIRYTPIEVNSPKKVRHRGN